MAETTSAPAPAPVSPTTVAELASAFPDLVASIRADAAALERDRVLGIAALGDGSTAALVAAMQADGRTSVPEAALRILNAQKEARGQQLQAIKDVETSTGALQSAPAARVTPPAPAQASTPEGWKAQYESSDELQREFTSAEAYVAYQAGVAGGNVRLLSRRSA